MDIWTNKVVASTPVSYAKSALALAPTKIEDLKAVYMANSPPTPPKISLGGASFAQEPPVTHLTPATRVFFTSPTATPPTSLLTAAAALLTVTRPCLPPRC